jgi:UDP-N-acetylmuramoylalanine--D-glutamate ligase
VRPPLPGGPYLVVGLARSGVAAARALLARGEQVLVVDAGTPEVPRDIPAVTGTDGLAQLDGVAAVVKSPGVPAQAPVIAEARRRGVPVMGELELAWRLVDAETIAVTGTNGKTTTVELLGEIHRAAGQPVRVVGNVGTAYASLAGEDLGGATIVCEASSFQLEDTLAFAPEAAILLNLEPDHLDRHGTLEAYRDAKLQAFARQGPEDIAVAPIDVPGAARRVAPLEIRDGALVHDGERIDVRLRGPHNLANAAAAASVALARGVDPRPGLATFAGVEHRLEEVDRIDGVLYVNDSKATNVASTLVALASFTAPVHLILGGQGKGQDFAPLRAAAAGARVYLIGEDAERIGEAVGGESCGDLETAVARASARAREGDVVLLSPACASFDQFADYEARGRAFKELVRARRSSEA